MGSSAPVPLRLVPDTVEVSPGEAARAAGERRHVITVALEDYFHVGAFNRLIQHGEWYRFESRLEAGTGHTLDFLEDHGVCATFFALGWVADHMPELVRAVADRGHEIASKGYYHRAIRSLTRSEFREDLARAREALERASGRPVVGYRLADGWFGPDDLWALEVLAEEGYRYDSSIAPIGRRFASEPWRQFTHAQQFGERTLWEFPISTYDLLGFKVPVAGGNYFRQLPRWFVRRAVASIVRQYSAPYVLYFHTWEMDPDQPRISAASRTLRLRHYRNLDRFPSILGEYLQRYRFVPAGEYLGLEVAERRVIRDVPLGGGAPHLDERATRPALRVPVTIVVPVFNEELILPYLANTLDSVRNRLGGQYDLRFIFVDDASADGTPGALARTFGGRDDCRVLCHPVNTGVAGAILTGIRAAETEIVCSIDCDCTYDPHELAAMIPLLQPDVVMVTGSPYHPAGCVRNVPRLRLALSRCLSVLYRFVLHNRLHTYTSCFRVYRRSALQDLRVDRGDFLGVAEMLGRLDLGGGRVVEHPTTLEVRLLGRSKMKILRVILGHLGLLARLTVDRLRRQAGASARRRGAAVEQA